MKAILFSLGLLALALRPLPCEATAPFVKPVPPPLKGVVAKGNALTVVTDKEWNVNAWIAPLSGARVREVKRCAKHYPEELPERWGVGHGGLWLNNTEGTTTGVSEYLTRYELGDLLGGRLRAHPQAHEGRPLAYSAETLGNAPTLAMMSGFAGEFYYDYLPAGPYRVKEFLITNVRGRVVPAGKGELLAMRYIEQTGDEKYNPVWSLTVRSYQSAWVINRGWKRSEWVKEGTVEVGFREKFRVLARGDDYYFLTDSGRLFRAPKPAKGKHRSLEAVWEEWRNPVTALIHDADRDRAFLFCDKGPSGIGGPMVFELGSGVRPRFYDPKLLREGDQGPKQLRRVVGYARVLESLGYVKVPPATSTSRPKK